jgi:5-methylcytosine-specific restriction endonuclease McrA
MPHKSYSEKLKDPRWQRVRLHVLERSGWKCEGCGATTTTLHVHHGYYERGREPWEYDSQTLWALCEECHEDAECRKRDFQYEAAHLHPLRISPGLILECRTSEDDAVSYQRGDSSKYRLAGAGQGGEA